MSAPTAAPPQAPSADDVAAVQRCEQAYNRIRDELAKVIVGQDLVIEQVLVAIFARGHALLEGVPGLAKTLLINGGCQPCRKLLPSAFAERLRLPIQCFCNFANDVSKRPPPSSAACQGSLTGFMSKGGSMPLHCQ